MSGDEYKDGFRHKNVLYGLLVLAIALIGTVLIIKTAFVIRQTEVSGCVYSDSQDVMEVISSDSYSGNSLILFLQLKSGKQPDITFVESVQVRFLAPWHICLEVTEKTLYGVIQNEDGAYSYFDSSGIVQEISDNELTELLLLEGTTSGDAVEGESLSLIPSGSLEYVTEVFALIEAYEIKTASIYIDTSGDIYLYTSSLTIMLGSNTNTELKFENLALIMDQLEGKTGTLDFTSFSESGDDIIFSESE